jgi:hypothetical protein
MQLRARRQRSFRRLWRRSFRELEGRQARAAEAIEEEAREAEEAIEAEGAIEGGRIEVLREQTSGELRARVWRHELMRMKPRAGGDSDETVLLEDEMMAWDQLTDGSPDELVAVVIAKIESRCGASRAG